MRTFDFTPYYRSTVGFDRLFDMLDQNVRSDWPPYNIEKKGEDQYRITMIVAGFALTKSSWSSMRLRSWSRVKRASSRSCFIRAYR